MSANIYTCPMHPEIKQESPGSCPICGMSLELKSIAASRKSRNYELIDMTHRLALSVILTIPLLLLTMGSHLPGIEMIPPYDSSLLQLYLVVPEKLFCP